MVLINCSKFISFLRCIYNCPADVPGRHEALYQAYCSLEQTSFQVLSIRVRPDHDRVIQKNIDEEDNETRKQNIIKDIVDIYTPNTVDFTDLSTIFLIPSLELCSLCDNRLNISRPSRRGRTNVVVYTTDGPRKCVTFHKQCIACNCTVFYNYYEWTDKGETHRRYYDANQEYFASTQDTFFSISLLNEWSEDIFTVDATFTKIVLKYNNIKVKNDQHILYRRLVFPPWILYLISLRIPVEFIVQRNDKRELDHDLACKQLYPSLKQKIDSRWKHHNCKGCQTNIVVMDGNWKCYRKICAHSGEKVVQKGQLNSFTACADSPLVGEIYCKNHLTDANFESEDRADTRLTRSMIQSLGMSIDELVSGEGCRKPEAVAKSKSIKKTCGLVYCIRPCGIVLGHVEALRHESPTDFMRCLIDIFGEYPTQYELSAIVIDRACDVHAYCRNIGDQGNPVCQHYSRNKSWIVDPFHVRGHVRDACTLSHPDCQYHPSMDKHSHLVKNMNMEVCEQTFRKVNCSKHTTRFLNVHSRLCFLKLLDDERNVR